MFPLAVMLVVVIFVILAEGADKNTSAVRVWPSIVEPLILFVVVNDCKVMSSSCFNSLLPIELAAIVSAPPAAIVASPLTLQKLHLLS